MLSGNGASMIRTIFDIAGKSWKLLNIPTKWVKGSTIGFRRWIAEFEPIPTEAWEKEGEGERERQGEREREREKGFSDVCIWLKPGRSRWDERKRCQRTAPRKRRRRPIWSSVFKRLGLSPRSRNSAENLPANDNSVLFLINHPIFFREK